MNSYTPWRTARRVMALADGNQWYRIRNQTGSPSQLHIYDEIGMLGVSANDLIADLEKIDGPLEVHLNSPGGEVFEGLGIYNALLQVPEVNMYVDGIAASIASVVALAGTRIYIAKSGRMMVHDGFTMGIGNAQDMRELADRLDFESDNIAQIYADHCGGTAEEWREIMRGTKWYNAEQAIVAGLAHEITETRVTRGIPQNNSKWDMSIYQSGGRVPAVHNRAGAPPPRNAALHPYHGESEVSHEPVTGEHAHNHAAFGATDHDDGIHHHSHRHNGDAVHEHEHMMHTHDHDHDHPHRHAHEAGQDMYGPHKHEHAHHVYDPDHDGDDDSRPDDGHGGGDTDHDHFPASAGRGARNAMDDQSYMDAHTALHNAAYDSSTWDGGAAMKAAGASKSPASAFRAICAGRRNGPADERGSWALPHHKTPGSAPNRDGVNNALARLAGTQGLTNKDAAEAHLKAHQAAWGGGDSSKKPGSNSDQADTTETTWTAPTDQELTKIMNTLKGVDNK